MTDRRRRIGIVGFGSLGQYIAKALLSEPASIGCELVFVWNRSAAVYSSEACSFLPADLVLSNLSEFASRGADLIVEVAHPDITKEWGARFLEQADYLIGSPTAMADPSIFDSLCRGAEASTGFAVLVNSSCIGVYVPAGALWGGQDLRKMADAGELSALTVRMKKHPLCFKLNGPLQQLLNDYQTSSGELTLYDGPLRDLCPVAPNNVNTMACAAIAGHTLGFDGVRAVLVANDSLDVHIVEVEAFGAKRADGSQLEVRSSRVNPAAPGAVTGTATLNSFVSSVICAARMPMGNGLHLC